MKKKVLIGLGALSILIAGFAAGAVSSSYFVRNFIQNYMTMAASAGVGDRVTVLQTLHSGETNKAMELLEIQLDGEIIALGSLLKDLPADKREPLAVRILTRAREYRVAHPRTTDSPEIDQGISNLLSLTASNQVVVPR